MFLLKVSLKECMFYVDRKLRVGLVLLSHSNNLYVTENDSLTYDYFFLSDSHEIWSLGKCQSENISLGFACH